MGKMCLALHGFTGGPFEVEPLARYLEARGWTCVVPTLPGHEAEDRLGHVRWSDWIEAAEAAAKRIVDEHGALDLIGFSMGGVLAAHLAVRFPVRRLVLLNAAAIYISPGRLLREVAETWKERNWERLTKVGRTPLRATVQFMRVVRSAKPLWTRIHTPTLIVQSGMDPVVHPLSAKLLASKIPGAKQVRYFPLSKHVICLDREADQLFPVVERFLSD